LTLHYNDLTIRPISRVLAAQDVPYVRASTDLGNVPMAAAFHRAGWVTTGHQIDMTWDAPTGPPG